MNLVLHIIRNLLFSIVVGICYLSLATFVGRASIPVHVKLDSAVAFSKADTDSDRVRVLNKSDHLHLRSELRTSSDKWCLVDNELYHFIGFVVCDELELAEEPSVDIIHISSL